MFSHQHKLSGDPPICPVCNKQQDGATGGDRAPKEGDYCICIYCATISVYHLNNNTYTLTQATEQDFEVAKQEGVYDEIKNLQTLIQLKNAPDW